MSEALLGAVETFFARSNEVHRGDTLMVGVSGGVDSVSLLHALHEVAPGLGLRLHVVHLDHRLRGVESATDAGFVASLARQWGLEITVEAADVAAFAARRHLSLEAAARAVRYSFFAGIAARLGASAVAVGHNADDQVETLLLHLVRGAGLAGLRGMRPVQRLGLTEDYFAREARFHEVERPSVLVLRPLLEVSRDQIVAYAQRHALPFRRDASNEDRAHLRNRVRHELVPLLETYNHGFRGLARRTAGLLADDFEYLHAAALGVWERCASVEDGAISLALDIMLAAPLSVRRLLVREAYARLVGDTTDLSAANVADVLTLAERGRTGAALSLPGRVRVLRTYGALLVAEDLPERTALPAEGIRLNVPGVTAIEPGSLRVEAALGERRCDRSAVGDWHVDLDLDRAGADLRLRRRRAGDRLRPLGLGGGKKVQDILVDAKVPRWARDSVPVVTAVDRVVWLAGHAVDESVCVRDDTKRVVCLRVHKKGSK